MELLPLIKTPFMKNFLAPDQAEESYQSENNSEIYDISGQIK